MKYLWFKSGMTGYVTNNETLDDAVSDGASIVRENDDGTLSIVYDGAEWVETKPDIDAANTPFLVVEPQYVDERMVAVVDVFDALCALMFPEAVTLALDDSTPVIARNPEEAFKESLAILKAKAQGGGAM